MSLPSPERPRHNIALIVSISLNLILAGIIATAAFRFFSHMPNMHPGDGRNAAFSGRMEREQVRQVLSPWVLMHIAPEKKDQLRVILDAHRPRIEPLRADTITARRHVLELYTAPDLDRPALDKALARMQAADAAFEIELTKVASETGAVLTPEERQQVIQWRMMHGGGRHGFGPRDGDGPRDGGGPPPGP